MPTEMGARYRVVEWLMFQMANVGPMLGQARPFRNAAPEKIPYAIERYTNESRRLFNVIDRRLADGPLPRGRLFDRRHRDLSMGRRRAEGAARAVGHAAASQALDRRASRRGRRCKKGWPCMADQPQKPLTEEERAILYGAKQHERR